MASVGLLLAGKALEKAIEKLVEDIYEHASAELKRAVRSWKAKPSIAKLYTRALTIRNVKTIWQVEKEIDLAEFYYPSKVTIGGRTLTINDLPDFGYRGNILVRGTVGQGKSILFRYLASRELTKGRSVPVFLELRRIRDARTLLSHVIDELNALGLDANEEVFSGLASSGSIVLFLDAFDEVPEGRRHDIIDEIELLTKTYHELRVVVSSRHGSGIENSAALRVADLAPLERDEYKGLVVRMIHDPANADEVIKGAEKSSGDIATMLTTPLMVALLVVRYRTDRRVPENVAAFYGNIFDLLLLRHDKSKAGYRRERKSDLDDADLRELFEALCFLTRKKAAGVFTVAELQKYVKAAAKELSLKCDASRVLDDYRNVTGLIVEEGGECKFIHKSVQEFHAARFIKEQPDDAVNKFYPAMQSLWPQWRGELRFLSVIDAYRFTKLFLIPDICAALGVSSDTARWTPTEATKRRLIKECIGARDICIQTDDDDRGRYPKEAFTVGIMAPGRWCARTQDPWQLIREWFSAIVWGDAVLAFMKEHSRARPSESRYVVNIDTAMKCATLRAAMIRGVDTLIKRLAQQLRAARQLVRNVEKRRQMLDF